MNQYSVNYECHYALSVIIINDNFSNYQDSSECQKLSNHVKLGLLLQMLRTYDKWHWCLLIVNNSVMVKCVQVIIKIHVTFICYLSYYCWFCFIVPRELSISDSPIMNRSGTPNFTLLK